MDIFEMLIELYIGNILKLNTNAIMLCLEYRLFHVIPLYKKSRDILNIVGIIMYTDCVAFIIGTFSAWLKRGLCSSVVRALVS